MREINGPIHISHFSPDLFLVQTGKGHSNTLIVSLTRAGPAMGIVPSCTGRYTHNETKIPWGKTRV